MQDAFNDALAKAGTGEKIRSAFSKYSQPGERHGGTVVSRDLFQSRDLKKGELEKWDDGNPIMKAKIVIQTDERGEPNPETGEPDDGKRYIVVKWYGDDLKALKEAVGADGRLDVGGWFGAVFQHQEPSTKPGFDGRKVYSYVYRPPAFVPQDGPAPQEHFQSQTGQTLPNNGYQTAPAQQQQFEPQQGGQAPGWAAPQPAQQPPAQQQQQAWEQQPRTAQDYRNAAMTAPQAAPAPQQAPAPQTAQQQVSPQQIQQLIGQGATDEDIMGATGASPEAINAVRALFPAQ